MKRILAATLALLLPLSLPAADTDREQQMRDAEKRLEQAAQEIATISSDLAGEEFKHVFKTVHAGGRPGRAMLGINVGEIRIERDDGSVEERGVRDDGVEVYGVTPDGPAAQAGLESGDVILALNGQQLAGGNEPADRRLIRLMDTVEPGETVTLLYRRGDRELTTDVVTGEFQSHAFAFGDDFDFVLNGEHFDMEEMMGRFPGLGHLGRHGAWRGLELVPLTPKLGSYFGTDSGLLVVSAPADDSIPLEEGDVILDIAGATPDSPPEAMRLLRFYRPGDQVVIDVLRQKRNRTLKITIPDNERD